MEARIGQQLGNYRLNSLIGKGGFAEVYLAEHIHLETLAAIKLLDMQLASEEEDLFRREARVIARLVHPNIIRVLDYGIDKSTPYLVMDYAPNGTLRDRHKRGERVPIGLVVTYVKQIAQALQFAHDQQIVHRDVKPQNMLLGKHNEILLSDFGIAVIGASTNARSVQSIAGTPVYMAPEQMTGHPSRASDQYALGIVIYEWLSGIPPFQGSSMEVITQQISAPPRSLREMIPSLSPIIEQVILKALSKDVSQRYTTIQEFADAFEGAVMEANANDETLKFVISPREADARKDEEGSKTQYGRPDSPTIPADQWAAIPSPYVSTSPSPWQPAPQWGSPPRWEISKEDIPTTASTYPYGYVPGAPPPGSSSTQAFPGSIYPQNELQDSFILYHRADRQWAEWIHWHLRSEHFSAILPVWSILPDTNLEMELQKAAAKAKHTIILLSPNFFRTFEAKPDWIEPLKRDAASGQGSLIAIYIRDYSGKHKKHLESIHYLDLSRDEEKIARKKLLEVIRGEYIMPDIPPAFPGRPHRRPTRDTSATSKKSAAQQEAQPSFEPSFSEADATRRALTFMQEIELVFAQEDWPAVIRKIELLEKQSPHLLSDQLYYMQGKAYLEEGLEELARKALNYALALISDQQERLTVLRNCARLMTAHHLWSDVLSYSNEALKLLPGDLDWLLIQEKAEREEKKGPGKASSPSSPSAPPPKGIKSIEVFFSYSHQDKKYRTELENYLSHLKRISSTRSWRIEAWYDGEIGAGREYAQEISKHLSKAEIILLLISQAFIASEYCYDVEMQKALERHEAGEARVIPIILRPANWLGTPIDKLQVLPTDAKPIIKWSRREDAFMDAARGIQKEIERLLGTA